VAGSLLPRTLDYEAAAAADTDGDGCPAGDEYFADTSPTNGASALKFLSMEPDPAGLRVEWEGGRNAWQILEECDALPDGEPAWRAIWTNPPVTSVRTIGSCRRPATSGSTASGWNADDRSAVDRQGLPAYPDLRT
jgi:hypothetical protein